MNSKIIVIIAALALVVPLSFAVIGDGSDAADNITVTDGTGTTVTISEPADKVVTIGKGVTSIAINLGCLDKIVVCDKYSYSATEEIFSDLKTYVDDGKITAGGSTYSSGLEQLETEVVDAADPETGSFDKETDALILTGTESAITTLKEYFSGLGFKVILCWYNATDYDDVLACAEAISKVLTGSVADSVEQMNKVVDYIADKIESSGTEVADAFYITWSSSNWKVGNTGSLGSSLITIAGGKSVTVDSSIDTTTYNANPTEVIDVFGTDTIIFADNSIAGNAERLAQLQAAVPGVTIVALESLWNNYSIESIEGVWTMACAMYPDLFEGDVPVIGSNSDNTMIYVVAGIVVVIAVVGIAVFMMRKP
jgi:ABC-type Fe3+-hydroxamate transport system substrate-binding protein